MKENEMPEKIYVDNPNHDFWYRTKDKNSIEYTRTDAFIEKAWDWIEDNILSSNQHDKSRLYFEQFVNYMKGE